MVNPHWDETINEDIGFKGPHFNESIKEQFSFGPSSLGQLAGTPEEEYVWTPEEEYGIHGEGHGWRSQEDPPSYRSDWQNYPADEFTGIQSNVPSGGGFLRNIFDRFGGNPGGLGGEFDTPYGMEKRKYDKYLEFMNQDLNRFNPEPGPWNEFNPSDLPHPYYPGFDDEVTSEDLLAYRPGTYHEDYDFDDYGPFVPPSVYELDEDFIYGPDDEHDFDRKKGYKNRIFGLDPNYVARGGLI